MGSADGDFCIHKARSAPEIGFKSIERHLLNWEHDDDHAHEALDSPSATTTQKIKNSCDAMKTPVRQTKLLLRPREYSVFLGKD